MWETPRAQEVLLQPQLLDGSRMQEAAQEAAEQLCFSTSADFRTTSVTQAHVGAGSHPASGPPFSPEGCNAHILQVTLPSRVV